MIKNYGIYPRDRNIDLGKILVKTPVVFDISNIFSTDSNGGNIGYGEVYGNIHISILFNMPAPIDTHMYFYVNYGSSSGVRHFNNIDTLPLKMSYDEFNLSLDNTNETDGAVYGGYQLKNVSWVAQSCLEGQITASIADSYDYVEGPSITDYDSGGESSNWFKLKISVPVNTTCINLPISGVEYDWDHLTDRAITFAAVVPTESQGMWDYVGESSDPATDQVMHWGAIIMDTSTVVI
jgi:hypothetical protein